MRPQGTRNERDDIRTRERVGPLEIVTWVEHGRAMAEAVGELDVYTTRELRAALMEVQQRAPRPVLVLVLSRLTFADSSGLGVLVGAVKRAKQDGGAVALVEAPEFFQKVLHVTGLEKVLPVFPNVGEAVAFLDSRAGAR